MHELEYELTGDYDSYSDINYGPNYGNEYKEGTVFDAEDEENYTTTTTTAPSYTPSPGDNGSGGNNDGGYNDGDGGSYSGQGEDSDWGGGE